MAGKSDFRIDGEGRECTDCKDYKLWEEFHVQKGGVNNRTAVCKPCRSALNAEAKGKHLNNGFSSTMSKFCLGRGIEDHE